MKYNKKAGDGRDYFEKSHCSLKILSFGTRFVREGRCYLQSFVPLQESRY
jgi:hypothetical protein